MGEDVLVIGVIRFSCYTYNHEPAFNIMVGGFGKVGFSIITELAFEDGCQFCLDLFEVLLELLHVTALGRVLR